MKRVEKDQDWYLFDPAETQIWQNYTAKDFGAISKNTIKMAEAGKLQAFDKVPARQQFKRILTSLEATSHPWLTWKDTINVRALNNIQAQFTSVTVYGNYITAR